MPVRVCPHSRITELRANFVLKFCGGLIHLAWPLKPQSAWVWLIMNKKLCCHNYWHVQSLKCQEFVHTWLLQKVKEYIMFFMVNCGFPFGFFYMEELITIGNAFLKYKYINKIKLQIIDIQTFNVIKHTHVSWSFDIIMEHQVFCLLHLLLSPKGDRSQYP